MTRAPSRPEGPSGAAPPLLLAFDTSAARCAAALLRGDAVLAEAEEAAPPGQAQGQAERLFPFLEALLAGAGLGWRDLGAVAAGTGPGGFTGVRVAVAAARGLALARGIPALGVTALEAAALGSEPCAAVAPAGRGFFGLQRPFEAPRLVAEAGLAEAAGELPLVGWAPGARTPAHPIAVAVARVAAGRLGAPQPRPAALYLRPPDAAPPRAAPPPLAAAR